MKLEKLLLFSFLFAPSQLFPQLFTGKGIKQFSLMARNAQRVHAPNLHITPVSTIVPENLETAFIYVDPNGNDSNSGTQSHPLKTLQAAVTIAFNKNKKNIGTRVTINPGTYREIVQYNGGSSNTTAPITFQALKKGTVILAGSDIYTGWKRSGNVFTHSWTSLGGTCALPNDWPNMWPIGRRREMVFVNGTSLTQVISPNQLVVGTFYVDDRNSLISVWPPAGTNMSTALIEVARRANDFLLSGATNFVFRGLVFKHAASCPQDGNGLTVNTSDHVLVDGNRFLWNNQSGLGFYKTSNVVVQNSVANHNGGNGMGGGILSKNYTYTSNETSYNGWRNAMSAFYGWAYAGAKFSEVHNAVFNGWKDYYNQSGGIWFDTDNTNISLQNLDISNNLLYGMFLEANEGPITISDSRFCNNFDNEDPKHSFGTFGSGNSEYVTVSNTLFYNNGIVDEGGVIYIGGDSAGRTFKNWETNRWMTVQSQNWTLNGDTVVGMDSSQRLFYSYLTGSAWNLFHSTFSSDNNTWWNPLNAKVFKTSAGAFNLSGWKSALGQDANSTFSDPASNCPEPTPEAPDYWLATYFEGDVKTISRGLTAIYTIQVFPVGAFSGTVNLSADGLTQLGATSSFGSSSIDTSGLTNLIISTTSSTMAGIFPITVIASSRGIVRTLTLTLQVK